MISLGMVQTLQIVKRVEFGVYLSDSAEAEVRVLLPKKQVPEYAGMGDVLSVFVYRDSRDRMIATTTVPKLTLHEVAKLRVWVITKSRFRVLGELAPGREYELRSFPRRTGSLIYDRDFYVLSKTGERLILGTSQWCVVNFLTRHVEQTDVDFKGEYTPETAIPEGIDRIRPRDLTPVGRHIVTEADLDENDHTNNCRYADMALRCLGVEAARELTMNFASETRLHDEIELFTAPGGIAAGKHNGSLVFAAKIN